ncbi:putative diguanylate cyclase YdaM [Thalassocella blandensis]|nr:putative diguanylate cyclase YdaM [Thalassocella blandensis]
MYNIASVQGVPVDSTGSYREKYRRAIDEQERMEKQFSFQLDALKKTLYHVSAAAQGLDKQLDASLINLKEKMRGASGQQVFEQMERVQKAAQEFEHNRHNQNLHSAKQLNGLVEQLASLKLPHDIRNSLEEFSQSLKKRLQSYRNYAEILDELRKLQEIALQAAANPPTGLWQRLKGGTTIQKHTQGEATLTPVSREASDVKAELSQADMDLTPVEGEHIPAQKPVSINFDPGDEDSYQAVAQRIARTLEGLVNKIEPNEVVRHKVDIVRLRIQRGMDWYVLAVTLEDIRDILLLRYLQNDQDFSEYLKNINEELRSIGESLGLVVSDEGRVKNASDKFSAAVTQQVEKMRTNMEENSANVDLLKAAVKDHLTAIQRAVEDFNHERQQDADKSTMEEQLKALQHRLHTIESESEKTKDLLEEQRYKATHDPLTGLPNREAYNERSYQELQRFKRYCRPLTMAVCDIDHFKKINDDYGHQAGDKIIKLIGKILSTRLRKVDFVGRYGGEEFVILLPETTPKQGLDVLDKVRALIAKTPFRFKDSPVQITISFGLAEFTAEDKVDNVFERADRALYRAKKQGRNCCVIYQEET